ncbi:efflux RND transporter permease subunit [Vibrio lentus]|nr:efflux RND transporter permease subunit [Vibrio lentus]
MGLVTLIGLISKHGILIVEFANQMQQELKCSRREAAIRSATVRMRPVLMTTAAMVVGVVPPLVASGAGAQVPILDWLGDYGRYVGGYIVHLVRCANHLHLLGCGSPRTRSLIQ